MSDLVTVARKIEFQARAQHLFQQIPSRFRDKVTVGTGHTGKSASVIEQYSPVELVPKSGRHSDIQTTPIGHSRRWVTPAPYEGKDNLDEEDLRRILMDPRSDYAKAFAQGGARKIDDVVIAAFLGTALTGESGTVAEAFDTTNYQIVHGSVGMTMAKLRKVLELWEGLDVDLENEERYLAVSPQALNNLRAETQIVSQDYNPKRDGEAVIQSGRVVNVLGINIVPSTKLTRVGTTRSCIAWLKSQVYLGFWSGGEIQTRIEWDVRAGTWQISAKVDLGASRLQQGGVIELQITEV